MAKNPCAKRVEPEEAYEVWRVDNHSEYGGEWTWYVLKKYQSPENEAKNEYARWFCFVTSPYVPNGEYGDVYASSIKSLARKIDNPLYRHLCVGHIEKNQLEAMGLGSYRVAQLTEFDERLSAYLKISVPIKDVAKVTRVLQEYDVTIVCIDDPDFVERCLDDVRSSE